jgi:hypothetical protein
MRRVVPALGAKLLQLQPVLVLLLVSRRRIIPVLAVVTLHGDDFAHFCSPQLSALSYQLSAKALC